MYNSSMGLRETTLLECDTEYGHYQVVDMIHEGRKARVLFTGKRAAAFSGMPLDDRHELLFDYIQRLYEFSCGIHAKNILVIGGGTFTLSTALLQTLPSSHITSVEIDPQLEVIAREYFNLNDNPRHTIINQDISIYFADTQQQFDLILIDAFSHTSIPAGLTHKSFIKQLHEHLSPQGIIAMNIISSYHGRQSEPLRLMTSLFRPSFFNVAIHPASNDSSLWQSQNYIIVAHNSSTFDHTAYMRYQPITQNHQ